MQPSYRAHLSERDGVPAGSGALDRLTKPRHADYKTVKGTNLFDPVDNALLYGLENPRINIASICRADLLALLDKLSVAQFLH